MFEYVSMLLNFCPLISNTPIKAILLFTAIKAVFFLSVSQWKDQKPTIVNKNYILKS